MYQITAREKVRFVLMDVAVIGVVSYLFYETITAFFLLLPLSVVLYRRQKRERQNNKKDKICGEFKELCIAISSNLAAGYSVENALRYGVEELKEMYEDKFCLAAELDMVLHKIAINTSVEVAFADFAKRTQLKEIIVFSEILFLAKRSSGNIIQIMKNTAEEISERIDLSRQVDLIFASRKYEQKIMNVIPFAIILYVKITSPELLDIMYHTGIGRIVMSICLAVIGGAVLLSEKIMESRLEE